jgi:hypothetical protein
LHVFSAGKEAPSAIAVLVSAKAAMLPSAASVVAASAASEGMLPSTLLGAPSGGVVLPSVPFGPGAGVSDDDDEHATIIAAAAAIATSVMRVSLAIP